MSNVRINRAEFKKEVEETLKENGWRKVDLAAKLGWSAAKLAMSLNDKRYETVSLGNVEEIRDAMTALGLNEKRDQ